MGDPNSEYRPPITFVVVQKRHHTRLFPARPNEGDRSGNILPGTHILTAALLQTGAQSIMLDGSVCVDAHLSNYSATSCLVQTSS